MPSSGSGGYVVIGTESVPGGSGTPNSYVTPTQMLKAEGIGVKTQAVQVQKNVFRNDRNTKGAPRLGKKRHTGPLTYSLYPNNGGLLLPSGIGSDTYLSAITSDTITGSPVTTLGLTTWTLVTGSGSYKKGALIKVTSDQGEELLPCVSYSSGPKTLVTGKPKYAHSTNIAIQQVGQHYIHRITGTYRKKLRTISAQIDTADLYAYEYAGGQIDTLAINASETKVDVSADLRFRSRTKSVSPVAWDESDASLNDLSFEVTDGFALFPLDPTLSNTATFQSADFGKDWSVTVKNNLKEQSCLDNSDSFVYSPQGRDVELKFKYLQDSNRPIGWEDFMKKEVDTSFQAFYALKQNSVWTGISFRFPTIRYLDAADTQSLSDDAAEEIMADVRIANGEHDFEVFLVNSQGTAY